ncbi:hypothetical protein [Candidatus Poriferisodalis sp.]|uniref:hypothetical protein n=1 Tax=Candidatus Poriferisodalis sp. TaxID=3101277 RepID=UPI003B026C17
MQIMSALFIEHFDMRQAAGGAARIDLGGVHFSMAAPGPFPVTINPHMLVLVRCPASHTGLAALEVRFMRGDEQVARNVQPLSVEPGKFGYNLVQAELSFDEPSTVEAHCRIDQGDVVVVPLTMNPPADDPAPAPTAPAAGGWTGTPAAENG